MNNLGSLLDMPELNSPKLAELWIANFGCLNVFSTSWKRQNLIRCSNIYLFIRLWLYLVNIKRPGGFTFLSLTLTAVSWWADAEREDGEEVWRNGGLLHTCSHASSDMVAIWLMGSARRNTHLNPASSSCIITCFLVPIRTGWLMASNTHTHTHKELGALMHSWHLSEADRAVDIFTTGAFMSVCSWWGWEHNGGESVAVEARRGWGCREEEGETRGVSKFRCSQLPEEHNAPETNKKNKKNPRILQRSSLLHPHRSSSILSSCMGVLLLCRRQQVWRCMSKTNLLDRLSLSMSYN